jgi:hypothetical protein
MRPSPHLFPAWSAPAILCLVLGALPVHGSGKAPGKARKTAGSAQPDRPALRELPDGPNAARSSLPPVTGSTGAAAS